MSDIRQSELYAKYMQSLGWIVEKIGSSDEGANVFIRKILFFSVIKIQRPNKLNLEAIKQLKNKYRAILVNVEPGNGWHLLPTKTVVLDLDKLNIPKDTRYEVRKAQQKNLVVEKSKDIDGFYKLLQETMKLGGWQIPIRNEVTSLYQSFQPNNSVILTTGESACLLIWDENTAHFMYAANSQKGLKLGGAYYVLNEAIKFCQKLGLKFLDLEGIYDDRFPNENKNWQGFTKFKLGWGGRIIEY